MAQWAEPAPRPCDQQAVPWPAGFSSPYSITHVLRNLDDFWNMFAIFLYFQPPLGNIRKLRLRESKSEWKERLFFLEKFRTTLPHGGPSDLSRFFTRGAFFLRQLAKIVYLSILVHKQLYRRQLFLENVIFGIKLPFKKIANIIYPEEQVAKNLHPWPQTRCPFLLIRK